MQTLLRDVRHSWRILGKNPSFTAVAVITLAFGIGASVANFAVVRGVLLRPLPYSDPSRLVRVYDANPARDANMSAFSPQDLDDFSRQQDAFENLGGYWYSPGSGGLALRKGRLLIWRRHLQGTVFSRLWGCRRFSGVLFVQRKT